ncbi:MAG: hypothetical protein U0796_19050 [Gemmatales bacterium]
METLEIARLEELSDEQLHELLRSDIDFSEALTQNMPELASDSAFDLYGKEWIKRYWKRLVTQVNGPMTSDGAMKWAVGASATALMAALAKYFDLPEAALPSAAALAILMLRTARSQQAPLEEVQQPKEKSQQAREKAKQPTDAPQDKKGGGGTQE